MEYRNFLLASAASFGAITVGFGANRLPDYGKLPLTFEINQGQADREVKFLAHGRGYTLFLTEGEAVIASAKSSALRMKFRGANPAAEISGVDEQGGKSNYFVGNDPKKWHPNVPTYGKVRYKDIYSGIDLVYYGNQRQLEYDFVVGPGADPRRIGFDVRGASRISRSADGDLVLGIGQQEVRWHRPLVYQEDGGVRREIAGRYVIQGKRRVGFELAEYDRRKKLFIDPVLVYSTYLGGSGSDSGTAIAVDSSGAAYVTGQTYGNFPTVNPLQAAYGGSIYQFEGGDAFVVKYNPSGTALVYSTYLGGNGVDQGNGIAVDSEGNAYVTGVTGSTNFPTINPLQPVFAGGSAFPTPQSDLEVGDAFVAKLNPSGSALIYSTYLGGTGYDQGTGIAVDSFGDAYVVGFTYSSDFPTANALQPVFGGGCSTCTDAFVAKFNPAGSALIYSTYLGGSGDDRGSAIVLDHSGDAYVTGYSASTNFPTVNAFQPANAGGRDAFVTKFNPSGSSFIFSTYLGGSGADGGTGIALDPLGRAFVVGITSSYLDFPTKLPWQDVGGQDDTFITIFTRAGTGLDYSTYFGYSGYIYSNGIAVDGSDDFYITGNSSLLYQMDPLQPPSGGSYYGAFVTKFSTAGFFNLIYSTYLGGTTSDVSNGIALDSSGNVYVTGHTYLPYFPLNNPVQPTYAGGFVTKLAPSATGTTLELSLNSWTFGPGLVGAVSGNGVIYVTNTGSTAANFTANPLVSSLPGLQVQNTCSPVLEAGAFCAIKLSYTPQTVGTNEGTLTMESTALNSPNVITIHGTGYGLHTSYPSWGFSPHPVGMTSGLGKIYLTNETPTPMNLSSTVVGLAGANPGDFSLTDGCSAAVAPYTTCELMFTFTPTAVGFRQAVIEIMSPQVQFGQVIIPIGGTGE